MTEETIIKNQIKEFLALKNIFNFHILQGLGCYKGSPDRVIIYKGRTIFCEIKKPNGYLSEYQEEFKHNVERSGGIYLIAKSIEDVIKEIKRIDKEAR